MSSGFHGGGGNDPIQTGQSSAGQQHPGHQAYQQPQYTQPLPAGERFPDPEPQWGLPQPNYPVGAGAPQYGSVPQPGQPYGAAQQAGPSQPQFGPGQVPPPPGGGPPRKRTGLVVAAVLGVVLLVGAVATAVLVNRGGSQSGPETEAPTLVEAGGTSAEQTGKPSTRRSSTPPSSTRPRPTGPVTPVIPGYQVISSSEVNAQYDVPPTWEKAPDGMGMEDSTAVAMDGRKYCPGSDSRTVAFLTTTPGTDTSTAATTIGKEAAKAGYQNDKPDGGKPSPFESMNGKVKGSFAEFTGSWKPQQAGCTTDRFSVYVFTFRLEGNECGALVIDADRGATGELDAEAARKILATLRPVS